jgi:hypothetical protein
MRIAALCADSSQVKDQRGTRATPVIHSASVFQAPLRCGGSFISLSGSLREYLVQKSLSTSGNKFAACLSLLSRSVGLLEL